MRNLTFAIVVLALAGAGVYAAVAANRVGRSSCTSTSSTAAQGSCAAKGTSNAASCEAPAGKLTGNFDAAMSGVCRFACATKLTYDTRAVLAQPGARSTKLTQCPVSGVVFVVDAGRPHVRIAGDEYATCCDRCATKLKRDPRHYLRI
jgi:hypothetical protein